MTLDAEALAAAHKAFYGTRSNDNPAVYDPLLNIAITAYLDALARRSIQEQPEADRVAWLIECKTPEGARWYFEDATGWHSWTPDAHLATSFKTKAEAEKFPAYVMIKTDPNISLTEHVFLEQWKHEPEAETANNVDDQGRAAPIFDRPAVHGETVGRDAAPPPIAGAGWKVEASGLAVATIQADDFSLIELTRREGGGFNLTIHAGDEESGRWDDLSIGLSTSRAAELVGYLAPVPDNTDARGAQVHVGTREVADELWCKLLPHMQVDSTEGYADKVAALDIIEAALAAAAIIPGTDASGVIEQLREALKPFAVALRPDFYPDTADVNAAPFTAYFSVGDIRKAGSVLAALDPVKAPKP